jgi:transcriptional regulator with XRE-family HTH domain
MSLVSENLKYLRKSKGLTQEQMAQQIGIKRSLLGAYEEGRAEPRIGNLVKFAEIFGLEVDRLISSDLAAGQSIQAGASEKQSRLKVLAITVDRTDRENIEFVPQKAAAGYLNGYADPEFIGELPRFQLPALPSNASYRAFEISGDSMLPIRSGTIVIGRYVEELADVKDGKPYVVITQQEGIVFKRLYRYPDDPGRLCLMSDNRNYNSFDVRAGDIIELWESKAYIAFDFPDPDADIQLSLNKLAGIVLDLQQEVIKLKDK